MIEGSLLATIAAGGGIAVVGLGVVGAMIWITLPREEDAFERSMADLLDLTSGSDHWPPGDPESGGRAVQQPTSLEGAPVRSIHSSPCRGLPGGAATDGAAEFQPESPSGPALFYSNEGNGPVVPVQRDRPALFRVK